jgi:hypothetical protein
LNTTALEDNIKMGHKEIGCEYVDWIHVAADKGPGPGSCEHGNELSGSIKCRDLLSRQVTVTF